MRPGQRGRRRHVAPRPEEEPLRAPKRLERPERVVPVPVRPAADEHGRAGDALVPGPQRPVAPVRAVDLLVEPAQEPRLGALDPAQPLVPPAVTEHGRDRRKHVHRRHVELVVDEVEPVQRPAPVVDVVRVPVVGRVDRADRPERRRPLDRELDGVEAGVRGPVHPDPPRAPVLCGEPRDDLLEVGLLLRRVLVARRSPPRSRCRGGRPGPPRSALPGRAARTRTRTTRSGRPSGTAAPRGAPQPAARREARAVPRAARRRTSGSRRGGAPSRAC